MVLTRRGAGKASATRVQTRRAVAGLHNAPLPPRRPRATGWAALPLSVWQCVARQLVPSELDGPEDPTPWITPACVAADLCALALVNRRCQKASTAGWQQLADACPVLPCNFFKRANGNWGQKSLGAAAAQQRPRSAARAAREAEQYTWQDGARDLWRDLPPEPAPLPNPSHFGPQPNQTYYEWVQQYHELSAAKRAAKTARCREVAAAVHIPGSQAARQMIVALGGNDANLQGIDDAVLALRCMLPRPGVRVPFAAALAVRCAAFKAVSRTWAMHNYQLKGSDLARLQPYSRPGAKKKLRLTDVLAVVRRVYPRNAQQLAAEELAAGQRVQAVTFGPGEGGWDTLPPCLWEVVAARLSAGFEETYTIGCAARDLCSMAMTCRTLRDAVQPAWQLLSHVCPAAPPCNVIRSQVAGCGAVWTWRHPGEEVDGVASMLGAEMLSWQDMIAILYEDNDEPRANYATRYVWGRTLRALGAAQTWGQMGHGQILSALRALLPPPGCTAPLNVALVARLELCKVLTPYGASLYGLSIPQLSSLPKVTPMPIINWTTAARRKHDAHYRLADVLKLARQVKLARSMVVADASRDGAGSAVDATLAGQAKGIRASGQAQRGGRRKRKAANQDPEWLPNTM